MLHENADGSLVIAGLLGCVASLLMVHCGGGNTVISVLVTTAAILFCSVNKAESFSQLSSVYWRTRVMTSTLYVLWVWQVVMCRFRNSVSMFDMVHSVVAVVNLFSCLLSIALLLLLPVPSIRKPGGKYQRIGTLSFSIPRIQSSDSKDFPSSGSIPKLPVQCWFPLRCESSRLHLIARRYSKLWTSGDINEEEGEGVLLFSTLAANHGLYHWVFHHLVQATSNSMHQTNLCNIAAGTGHDKLPVVLYSHGMHGWRQVHTTLVEELASRGFIVFAVDHSLCSTLARPFKDLNGSLSFDFHLPSYISDRSGGCSASKQFYMSGINRRVEELSGLLSYLENSCTYSVAEAEAQAAEVVPVHHPFYQYVDMNAVHTCGHSYGRYRTYYTTVIAFISRV